MARLQLHIFDRQGTPNTVTVKGSDGREGIDYTGPVPFEHRQRLKAGELPSVEVQVEAERVSPTLCLIVLVDGETIKDIRCTESRRMEARLEH